MSLLPVCYIYFTVHLLLWSLSFRHSLMLITVNWIGSLGVWCMKPRLSDITGGSWYDRFITQLKLNLQQVGSVWPCFEQARTVSERSAVFNNNISNITIIIIIIIRALISCSTRSEFRLSVWSYAFITFILNTTFHISFYDVFPYKKVTQFLG